MRTPRPRSPRSKTAQMRLPGAIMLEAGGARIEIRNRKIPHAKILKALQDSAHESENLVGIYRQDVLPVQTRTIRLLGKKAPARIINTLLGFEVQSTYKRIHCPDMVTARYLKLFTELGCHSIKLPYDPTVTARIIPALETAVNHLVSGVRGLFPGNPALQTYVWRRICALLRSRLRPQ